MVVPLAGLLLGIRGLALRLPQLMRILRQADAGDHDRKMRGRNDGRGFGSPTRKRVPDHSSGWLMLNRRRTRARTAIKSESARWHQPRPPQIVAVARIRWVIAWMPPIPEAIAAACRYSETGSGGEPQLRVRANIGGCGDGKVPKRTRCQQTARASAQPLLTPGLVDAAGHYGGDVADTEHHW